MTDIRLGDLVRKAKGEDRSLREYARNSGVDAAVVSKIINGSYVPKKTDIYRALTSPEASPRGGVTYKQLVEAADSSKSYQRGIVAGMAATEVLLSAIGGITIQSMEMASLGAANAALGFFTSKGKKESDKSDELLTSIKRFAALASGLIYNSMAMKGIQFQVVSDGKGDKGNNTLDTSIRLEGESIQEYDIKYAYITEKHRSGKSIVESISKGVIAGLVFIEPSVKRKISIVTNSVEAYDYMLIYKNKLSYSGELSVILVDEEKAVIVKEEYIAHNAGDNALEEIRIL